MSEQIIQKAFNSALNDYGQSWEFSITKEEIFDGEYQYEVIAICKKFAKNVTFIVKFDEWTENPKDGDDFPEFDAGEDFWLEVNAGNLYLYLWLMEVSPDDG